MRLPTHAPFDLEATVRLLQRRPSHPVEHYANGAYQRLHLTGDGPILVHVRNIGSVDHPDLHLTFPDRFPDPDTAERLGATVRRTLGLDVNLRDFFARASQEPALRPLARRFRGIRPPRFNSLFEAIASVIPFQQLSLDAGMATLTRLISRFATVSGTFPGPKEIAAATEDELASLGLARTRARALQVAARAVIGGHLTESELEHLPTEEARRNLEKLRGIGPWSASLILLRGFGRLDLFPGGDVGVARGLGAILGAGAGFQPEKWAASFGPQRGMLYFFSLGAMQLRSGLLPSEAL